MTHFLWLGDELIKGSLYMECVWIWRKSDGPGSPLHTHEYKEVLAFFGTNPEDIHDLSGELGVWLEDEKHMINKSCPIFIPAVMKHCPLRTSRLERPIIHFALGTEGKYI